MKKLLLLLVGLCFMVGCSSDGDDCNCEAIYTYEFGVNGDYDELYEDFPRNPQTGNLIMERRKEVPCGTVAADIEIAEEFPNEIDMTRTVIGNTEKIRVDCD